MFFPNSRYWNATTYSVPGPRGEPVLVTHPPAPRGDQLVGHHQRHERQRLDLLAAHYLNDATAFWRLCNVNRSVVPDTLAHADLVGIPRRST